MEALAALRVIRWRSIRRATFVDDCKARFTDRELTFLKYILDKNAIKIGTLILCADRSVEFCGVTYAEDEQGVVFHQDTYIKNKLTMPDRIPSMKSENEYILLNEDQLAVYATCIGRLIWILPCQLRSAYDISRLARRRTCARARDFTRLRSLIVAIRANRGFEFRDSDRISA